MVSGFVCADVACLPSLCYSNHILYSSLIRTGFAESFFSTHKDFTAYVPCINTFWLYFEDGSWLIVSVRPRNCFHNQPMFSDAKVPNKSKLDGGGGWEALNRELYPMKCQVLITQARLLRQLRARFQMERIMRIRCGIWSGRPKANDLQLKSKKCKYLAEHPTWYASFYNRWCWSL